VSRRRILLSVGDDSGDLHAANLMRAMRQLDPELVFVGFGMSRMVEAGLEPLEPPEPAGSALWLHNLARLGRYRRRLRLCVDYMEREGVDLVLPVDFGGFNLCLCREASARGVPVFYYIPPQVWAHGRYRLKKLRKWVSRAALIYPFEAQLYRRYGVEAEYVGHPLFDELQRNGPSESVVGRLRQRFGRRLVGVFPGSRRQEIRAHVPLVLKALEIIRRAEPDAAFAVVCPARLAGLIERPLAEAGLDAPVLEGVKPAELARASRVCMAKSGTVTLEIASQGTPVVIFYRVSALVAFLARGVAHTNYMGIVNCLAGRPVCPERAMVHPEPNWLAERTLRLLQQDELNERCRAELSAVLRDFARPGASARAAHSALELLEGSARRRAQRRSPGV